MSKRIDELAAHPFSTTSPLGRGSLFPVRDPDLSSDNTRKVDLTHVRPWPRRNVLDYGADPTGSADSTDAIQTAIDSEGGYGNTVFIPRGVYKVTQLIVNQGTRLVGDGVAPRNQGGTELRQADGVNLDLIISDPNLNGQNYTHWTVIKDIALVKMDGQGAYLNSMTDRSGGAIYFPNFCGEGTKFENILIEGFPQHGLHVKGAITCWFQDIAVFNCGISTDSGLSNPQAGYGIYLENPSGFTGHYLLGISGDNNANALIGTLGANVWISGVKAECHSWQNYVVELAGQTNNNHNWCMLSNVVATLNASISPRPSAVAHIVNYGSGYQLWLQGVHRHEGATSPDYLIIDDTAGGGNVAYRLNNMLSYWNSYVGEVFRLNEIGGWVRTAEDPPAVTYTGTHTFTIGHTNGAGSSASSTITADTHSTSGSGTVSPTSLKVNRWVRAQLDGVDGWMPFFT